METLHVESSELDLSTPPLSPPASDTSSFTDRERCKTDDHGGSRLKDNTSGQRDTKTDEQREWGIDVARDKLNSVPTTTPIVSTSRQIGDAEDVKTRTTEISASLDDVLGGDKQKLSAAKMQESTSLPKSLPSRSTYDAAKVLDLPNVTNAANALPSNYEEVGAVDMPATFSRDGRINSPSVTSRDANLNSRTSTTLSQRPSNDRRVSSSRPSFFRAISTPQSSLTDQHALSNNHRVFNSNGLRHALDTAFEDTPSSHKHNEQDNGQESSHNSEPPLPELPVPPFSIPTYLHLDLSADLPSPLYIYRPAGSDTPYEPSRVKFERLLNFLLLPPQLERVLFFGALTCLDAWLYTFTILPLRFLKALWILLDWALHSLWKESRFLCGFIYAGIGRIWHRRKRRQSTLRDGLQGTEGSNPPTSNGTNDSNVAALKTSFAQPNSLTQSARLPRDHRSGSYRHHVRRKSVPSLLQSSHKADLLQGLLIIFSCTILMRFDASKMYHSIRGQAAIKLYVIYNVLEVFDRLFSALGQDIIECLFSAETLDRKANGRSKIITPFWMFLIALLYTVLHAAAFFYQVITLNVAVNSYSNALLTLLMSNQFVEIKGAVFKRFEKENLFQLACADVVERFQLWLMLLIIALRNIVELGGLSIGSPDFSPPTSASATAGSSLPNTTLAANVASPFSILPDSFTLLPSPAQLQLLTPFLLVLGSEMLVDWVKHAYISKFNAVKPAIYARFYDVLAKDYYVNAFGNQNLIKRLGLPVIPLSCLFIRAILQTYHMFLATNIPAPVSMNASSSVTSLVINNTTSASASASPALAQIDAIFRNALGRSSFGGGSPTPTSFWSIAWWSSWTLDDVIALTTMLAFFAIVYLLLLAAKIILGMILLSVARERYRGMQERERKQAVQGNAGGMAEDKRVVEKDARRLGGWGVVEVGEERRKLIYDGDEKGLQRLRDKEARARDKSDKARDGVGDGLEHVDRYSMVAKRIW